MIANNIILSFNIVYIEAIIKSKIKEKPKEGTIDKLSGPMSSKLLSRNKLLN
jgi:hypothetical protein